MLSSAVVLRKQKERYNIMKSRRIYDHNQLQKDHEFRKMIKNAPKMSIGQLIEESDKLWRETVKREKMAREHKRKLRLQNEANQMKAAV